MALAELGEFYVLLQLLFIPSLFKMDLNQLEEEFVHIKQFSDTSVLKNKATQNFNLN